MQKIDNCNIQQIDILTPPEQLKRELPLSHQAAQTIIEQRQHIENIIKGSDKRLMVIAGPCSIHDIKAAKEYAVCLRKLQQEYNDQLLIVMRVYFEKPRTHIGWKGFINDPDLDGTFNINSGLRRARAFLLWLAELGLPAATEALDPVTPQYLSDLFCWAAIGARTTESQTHREMASGLSMPVGFKNGTNGSLEVAINALIAASNPHHFIGIDKSGQASLLHTKGNLHSHIILRGGKKPNYDSDSVHQLEQQLIANNVQAKFVIDCSHGNSNKDYRKQPKVCEEVVQQIISGNKSIVGLMLESHLYEGNQAIKQTNLELKYGQSITDACISWPTTEQLLAKIHHQLELHRSKTDT